MRGVWGESVCPGASPRPKLGSFGAATLTGCLGRASSQHPDPWVPARGDAGGVVTLPPVLRRGWRWHRVPLARVEGQSRGAVAPAVSPPNRGGGRLPPRRPSARGRCQHPRVPGADPRPGGVCLAAGICPAAGDAMTWTGGGAWPGPPRDRRATAAEGSVSDRGGTGGRSPGFATPRPCAPRGDHHPGVRARGGGDRCRLSVIAR